MPVASSQFCRRREEVGPRGRCRFPGARSQLFVSPNGAAHDSPGQRPEDAGWNYQEALKGRISPTPPFASSRETVGSPTDEAGRKNHKKSQRGADAIEEDLQ